MKKVAVFLASLALMGCFQKPVGTSQKPAAPTQSKTVNTIENEFVFGGDVEAVKQVLNDMQVKATFLPIVEGESYQVRYSGEASFDAISEAVKPVVEYVEPNFKVETDFSMNRQEWPADKLFFKQWAMNNIGQSAPFGLPGERGADLNLMDAWKVTKGSRDVIVAVVDTGIDYRHPDLRANIWVNDKEAPANGGVPGKDDDGNGYTDDIHGYDFTSGDRTALHYGIPGDADPMDEDGHGTHCAGGIGAVAENDIGVVGVAWNVRLMAVKGLTGMGGSTADLARAIVYAVRNKADIISASWGGGGRSMVMQDALRRAEREGVLFVAAAGNDGANTDVEDSYPSGYDRDDKGREFTHIVSVGASDNQDNPADFSNYGHLTVDVFAPGVNIISTYPTGLAEQGRPPYAVMSGTSMATPYVSGIAALMVSANSGLRRNPKLTRDALIASCDEKPSLIGKAVCNGRVNAHRAVTTDTRRESVGPNWQTMPYTLSQRGFTQELVDIRHKIEVPNARYIRAHFDFLNINEPYDSVYIYDRDLRLIGRVEKSDATDLWSPTVPGDTMYVRFVNSIVKRVTMMPMPNQDSEATCSNRGASDIRRQPDGRMTCMVDSADSSDNGSKQFNSFNSEGFTIDQVAYVAGTPSVETR